MVPKASRKTVGCQIVIFGKQSKCFLGKLGTRRGEETYYRKSSFFHEETRQQLRVEGRKKKNGRQVVWFTLH